MKTTLLALLLAGCSFPTRSAEFTCGVTADCDDGRTCEQGFCVSVDGGGEDRGIDGGADAAPFDCTKFTTRLFTGCDLPAPGAALEITGIATYNTDTGVLTGAATSPPSIMLPAGRVISIDKLTIAAGAKLRVTGAKPLVIASWSTADIAGTIDVSSTPTDLGAGANPAECSTHLPVGGQNNDLGAGGGGGAGYAAVGGKGGRGDDPNNSQGGNGGALIATAPLVAGGCGGAVGGNGRQPGGLGGAGGGAVAVTALESITVSGLITAGGGGGGGARGENGGGGGGGSGGMINLESATVSVLATGTLAVNGGAGGSGSRDINNLLGNVGQDGQPSAIRAVGGLGGDGSGGSGGGSGGLGGAGTTLAGAVGQDDNDDAGGGGGGGAGFVVISSTSAPQMAGVASALVTTVPR